MKRFKRVYIEITNVCNMNCSFCSPMNRKKEFMTLETFRKLASEIKPFCDYVYLHIKGEPLLHPQFFEILDICHAYELKVNLTTNATLLPRIAKEISKKPAMRQINISLHSFEQDHEMDQTAEDQKFSEYMNHTIEATQYIREHSKMFLVYRLWNLPSDRTLSQTNDQIIKQLSIAYNVDIKQELAQNPRNKLTEKTANLADKVYLSQEQEFVWPSVANQNSQTAENMGCQGFCYGMVSMVGILVDGTMVPCCLDADGDVQLGNIHKQSFGEIIHSKRATHIDEGFKARKVIEPFCQKCSYRKRFTKQEDLKVETE